MPTSSLTILHTDCQGNRLSKSISEFAENVSRSPILQVWPGCQGMNASQCVSVLPECNSGCEGGEVH